MELPPRIPLNCGHRFCEMELEHIKLFLGLSRHFTTMSTIAAPSGPRWSHIILQKRFGTSPTNDMFHFCLPFGFC
jgi:hypothetical protein